MLQTRNSIISLFLLCFTQQAWAEVRVVDVEERLSNLICQFPPKTNLTTLWQEGIVLAQIRVQTFVSRSGEKLEERFLDARAKLFAKSHRVSGYAIGWCGSDRAWVAAFPAISQPTLHQNQIAGLEKQSQCAELSAHGAEFARGPSFELTIENGRVTWPQTLHGVVSVVCVPKSPSWIGPQQLYMIPAGEASTLFVPAQRVLGIPVRDPSFALRLWINTVRDMEDVTPLRAEDQLDQVATILASGSSINHDRLELNHYAEVLSRRNLRLLGEDRVRGSSLTELATLLWISPRHRDLLLNPHAELLGVHLEKQANQWFAVIITGAQNPPAPRMTIKGHYQRGL
jgi:hypothetical protein